MNRFTTLAAAFTVFALASLPFAASAAALEAPTGPVELSGPTVLGQEGHEPAPTAGPQRIDKDVIPRVKWMVVGIAVSVYGFSMLYLLKKRVGGFPENPSWVAPITIMPSSELPGDSDPHGGDSHGQHAPAH